MTSPIAEPQVQPVKPRLGEYLLARNLISQTALDAALEEQRITKEKLGFILTRNGFLTRAALIDAILALNPERLHGESLFTARVPGELLMRLRTMVVAETKDSVFLATLLPEAQVRVELSAYYPEKIVFVAANHEQVDTYLEKVRSMSQDTDQLSERLLRRAFSEQVSDVLIIPRYASYTVFFRSLGVRHLVHEGPLDEYNTLAARIKDQAKMDLAERRVPQDGGFGMDYDGKLVDLRVATVPSKNGETIVIRLLDPDRVQPSLTGLGITRVEQWRKGVSRPDGLALICGPTGSGKTTTLNASIKEMDRFGRSINTLEDPVEYGIAYVNQVNINHALGLDFARGIRAFMRADPDIIVVGEVRDPETARNAIKAAETGHLVLATLHTGSIFGAVQRLRDLEVPAHELKYLLRTVLVQRLVRTYCPHCQGKGCAACNNRGYAGRTVVSECAYFGNEHEVMRLLDGECWWPTMLEDALLKYRGGITSVEEVERTFGAEATEAILKG